MKAADLHKHSFEELVGMLGEAKEELFNLRFQLATNQLDNTAEIPAVKRNIARIRTVMRQQELTAWREQQLDRSEDS